MRPMKNILAICLFGFCLTQTSSAFGQDKALQQLALRQLNQGKTFFWEAKFDQSLQALRQVIRIPDATTEHLLEAYLYIGFALTRQNASNSEVEAAFEQAIMLDPTRELDEEVIPPDLTDRFNSVRDELVGCLYITSEPRGVKLMVVQEDSVLYHVPSPTVLCELADEDYQLLATKDGFEEHLYPLELIAGETDTLFVTLAQGLTSDKKGKKKVWGWVVRGSIAAATATVLYMTFVEGSGDGLADLPGPPDRPSR